MWRYLLTLVSMVEIKLLILYISGGIDGGTITFDCYDTESLAGRGGRVCEECLTVAF